MPGFVNYKKGCTQLATVSDKVYQLLAHGRWFSPGTPASSTTKTGHHDIVEISLKVALNTINQIKSIKSFTPLKLHLNYSPFFFGMLFFFLYKLTDLFTVMRRELSNDHDILTTASSSEESLTITRTGRHGSD